MKYLRSIGFAGLTIATLLQASAATVATWRTRTGIISRAVPLRWAPRYVVSTTEARIRIAFRIG